MLGSKSTKFEETTGQVAWSCIVARRYLHKPVHTSIMPNIYQCSEACSKQWYWAWVPLGSSIQWHSLPAKAPCGRTDVTWEWNFVLLGPSQTGQILAQQVGFLPHWNPDLGCFWTAWCFWVLCPLHLCFWWLVMSVSQLHMRFEIVMHACFAAKHTCMHRL